MSGHRKSFHAERKAKMASAARTGWDSGSTIRVNTCQALAPSMRAASSSSAGMVRKNCRSRNTPKAKVVAASGTIRPGNVLSQPSLWTSTYWGTRTTAFGIMRLPTSSAKTRSRPAKRMRQGIGGHGAGGHDDDHRPSGDHQAVEERAADARRPRATEQHLPVVLGRDRPWEPLGGELHDIRRDLHRGDHHPHDRQEPQ